MSNLINLTIRIDADLKKDAEIACAYLNTTISHSIRQSLSQMVRQHHQTRTQDASYAKASMESEGFQKAYQLVVEFMELNGNEFKTDANGKLILNDKEQG